jgi:capsular polysaccharide biosynthesis protein
VGRHIPGADRPNDKGETVDFWDLTKLLVRRWVIVLPMLALSVALAVLTVGQVKPDYVATAYVQLVPPVLEETKPGQATPDQRNPWLGLGLQTIGNAAIVTVTDQSVIDQLKAGGYSDSYTLTMASQSPLITFEVIGKSAQQARDTAEQLVSRYAKSVSTLQSTYGVSVGDSITARRLDLGTNVVKSTSKVKRALVAVAGAGLLLTVAVTVGFDAWVRRRRRRLEEAAAVAQSPPVTNWVLPSARAAGVAGRMRRTDDDMPTATIPAANGKEERLVTLSPERTQALGPQLPQSSQPTERTGEAEQELPVSSDATVILPPLIMPERTRWFGREKKSRS